MKKLNIGVVGHTGMVGSQVYSFFKTKLPTFGVSKHPSGKLIGSWTRLNENCEVIFVCVPTPYNFKTKRPDFGIVEEVLKKIDGGKIAVIKSTIWPGTTESLQKKHRHLKLLFNPEFLSRSTAKQDFLNPDRQIVGYTKKSKSHSTKILRLLPKGKYNKTIKSSEAELIKYSHNVYGAMRIIYANHLYDVCRKLSINYDEVKNGFAASEFVGPGALRYMNIFHNGKRGYAGPCFPKDVNAYIDFCNEIGVDAELVKATRAANKRILSDQGLKEEGVEGL